MMRLWPIYSFEIETSMSAEAAVAALSPHVEQFKWFRFSRSFKKFQGTVSQNGFSIMRIIYYHNSFLPLVRGTFSSGQKGTAIKVRMALHPAINVFMCVWLGFFGIAILIMLIGFLSGQRVSTPSLLILFGSPLFFMWLLMSTFWLEVHKTKTMLLQIFKGEINKELIGYKKMDKIEAKEIATEEIEKLRKISYADLCKHIDKNETFEVVGKSGVKYQLEIQYMWDDPHKPNHNLRVWVNIDDGGWRAFRPMSECFIISPEGKFIGE